MEHSELNNIVIISGPSGAGEDSVIEGLKQFTQVNRVITTTARAMRPGESEGNPYHFISVDTFEEKIASGEMVEWARQYNGNLYGVTREELQRVNDLPGIGTWKIEYQGVITAKKLYPNIFAMLIVADSLEVLEERMRTRGGMTEEQIKERIEYTKEWLQHTDVYDVTVVNRQGKLGETIQEVLDILRKEGYIA